MSIREALLEAAGHLEFHHITGPRLSAEILLAHCLGVDRTYLFAHDRDPLAEDTYDRFVAIVQERARGVPLQYITGHQEFYGRDFLVDPSVLIPRPETEYIVESVLDARPAPGAQIIDVGTGSGCIASTLALELPQATVFAADISLAALRTAQRSAARLGANVRFVCMDVLDALSGSLDFVVSNPPYVPAGDRESLQREVRDHEPHLALFDPLGDMGIYRRLVQSALPLLKPGGRLIMEIGFSMEAAALALLGDGWESLPTKADLQGIPRTVIARKQ